MVRYNPKYSLYNIGVYGMLGYLLIRKMLNEGSITKDDIKVFILTMACLFVGMLVIVNFAVICMMEYLPIM